MGIVVAPSERLGHSPPARDRPFADLGRSDLGQLLRFPGVIDAGLAFFSVDTVLVKRLSVLFFIELESRTVSVTAITARPTGVWVAQQAGNLSMVVAERALRVTSLIRDRDAPYTSSFDGVFGAEKIRVIRTAVRAPRATAFAERFVGTVRREASIRW
jgi:hypothetical protein